MVQPVIQFWSAIDRKSFSGCAVNACQKLRHLSFLRDPCASAF